MLALAVVGLLIWGAATQDDLNSSEDDVSELPTQVSNESAESEAAKDLTDELAQDATERAEAEANEARAKADAAESRTEIAARGRT